MNTPARIFNLARPAAPKLPLAALVDRLRQLEPPPKPQAMLDAEEKLRTLRAKQEAANKELMDASRAFNAAHDVWNPALGTTPGPTMAQIHELQAAVRQFEGPINDARLDLIEKSAPWKRAYLDLIMGETRVVRTAVHELVSELENAIGALALIGSRANDLGVGSPWICRVAGTDVLQLLKRARSILSTDAQIIE